MIKCFPNAVLVELLIEIQILCSHMVTAARVRVNTDTSSSGACGRFVPTYHLSLKNGLIVCFERVLSVEGTLI